MTTARKESDLVEILSGTTRDNLSNGSPIALLIRNQDAKSKDYAAISDKFRPGHADWTYFKKYGLTPQPGGGRSSGRETVARVAAGAVARKFLKGAGITVLAGTIRVGTISGEIRDYDFSETDPLRFLDPDKALLARKEVEKVIKEGDSLGAVVELKAEGLKAGMGNPVFDKLEAKLGGAFFSIGGVRAVEFGEGLAISSQCGSMVNDPLGPDGPLSDRHGGVLGGISTGRPILARLFVRPTPSISLPQDTIDLEGNMVKITTPGRHDPCLAPRLAPVAEAMTLLVLADFFLGAPAKIE
jgi:chorismate synthase